MFSSLMLVIYLKAISMPRTMGSEETLTASELVEPGKSINLQKVSLLEDFKEREASIFESFPSKCFKKEKLNSTRSHFEYYQSTKSFYSKLATQVGLDAPLESAYSLSATLNSVTKKTSSS